jgi:hypothetical protein
LKPIFMPHAGEFLVGEKIERIPGLNVWLPSKDDGVDLLVTDTNNRRSCSLQVKLSRNYADNYDMPDLGDDTVISSGWFKFPRDKIGFSPADYWVLLVVSTKKTKEKIQVHHVVLKPEKLLERLEKTYGKATSYQFYLAVTERGIVFDWRGLKKSEPIPRSFFFQSSSRNYTQHLEDWSCLDRLS